MKSIKTRVHRKFQTLPVIRCGGHSLTSFSGLVIWQQLFQLMDIKRALGSCFEHQSRHGSYGYPAIVLLLIVHLVLGYRRLQDMRYYADDTLVQRALGLKRLPSVATVSRQLASIDETSVANLRGLRA